MRQIVNVRLEINFKNKKSTREGAFSKTIAFGLCFFAAMHRATRAEQAEQSSSCHGANHHE